MAFFAILIAIGPWQEYTHVKVNFQQTDSNKLVLYVLHQNDFRFTQYPWNAVHMVTIKSFSLQS
jgi:hypothetical protein